MSNSVKLHALSSREVIERLKESDHLLIEEIACQLNANILRATDLEVGINDQNGKMLERLKWILRNQVQVLGLLYKGKELTTLIIVEDIDIKSHLKELTFQLDILSLHLMTLFDESDYSTWNLLFHLDPHYLTLPKDEARSLPNDFIKTSGYEEFKNTPLLSPFVEKLVENKVDKIRADAARTSLEHLLFWSQQYESLINDLYNVNAEISRTLYTFHYIESIAAHLLGISLSFKLLLKLIDIDLKS